VVIRRVIAPRIDFTGLGRELDLPSQFPPAAQAEAQQAAAAPPALPVADRTDLPFVTIDPPTSMDLDQAMYLERRSGGGYRVHYAIADVAAYVRPDGAVAAEAWVRGQTVYLPDGKVALHPPVLSEGAASLLPDQVRAAVVWTIELDGDAAVTGVRVERAAVRSRAKLNYRGVQADLAKGSMPEPIALLPEIGALLIERSLARGAINLPIPDQEIEPVDGGGWELVLRGPEPVENFNAQISLLTGVSAAKIMLDGGVGLLRTMPPAPPRAFVNLRAAAASLGIDWPDGATPGRVIAGVDPGEPRGAAFLDHAAELMRGAGYTAFDGELPAQPEQAAVAAPYAHVTAPLRRLADRYATEVCLALYAGSPVPDWVRTALPKLPQVMSETDRKASAANRGAIDLTEAVLLERRVGEEFEAAVLDVEDTNHHAEPNHNSAKAPRAIVAIDEPAVRAKCEGSGFAAGTRIKVRLTVADPEQRRVLFESV
jgi:exoribonuclease R